MLKPLLLIVASDTLYLRPSCPILFEAYTQLVSSVLILVSHLKLIFLLDELSFRLNAEYQIVNMSPEEDALIET